VIKTIKYLMIKRIPAYGITFLILLFFLPCPASANTVALPLTIDYPFLRSLIIKKAFPGPGESALLAEEEGGCRRVVVSAPSFSMVDDHIRFECKIFMRIGFSPRNTCIVPIEWEGFVFFIQRPLLNDDWTVSFEIVGSGVYDQDKKPSWLAGFIWERVREDVHDYLEGVTVDLAPPLEELKTFLMTLFPAPYMDRADSLISSMRPGKVKAAPGALELQILTDVDKAPKPERDQPVEDVFMSRRDAFVRLWEAWDETLARILLVLSQEPLTGPDRAILLETLLETRHRFIARLDQGDSEKDFVRRQFVDAWKRLSPLYRRHLSDASSKSILGYLSFFTASDALVALDRLGPDLGIEMSEKGLIRLLGMIQEGAVRPIDYLPEVVPELRQVLGLGPPIEGLPLESGRTENSRRPFKKPRLFLRLPAVAWMPEAHAATRFPHEDLRQWVAPAKDVEPYIEKVRGVLGKTVERVLSSSVLPSKYMDLFRRLAMATAWQESCFRQFVEKNGAITFLVSYNGSSVGLMQINERVWRGIYERQDLRWDIHYNAEAGSEILDTYFNRYALRKLDPGEELGEENLARLVYAMYNGGPGQFGEFMKRRQTGDYYLSDQLFHEKFQWVKNRRLGEIKKCL
jgi:hypothetical protein